jgi:RimJ/RimL family protein N-acetyltransferase
MRPKPSAALDDAFTRAGLDEILAYTSVDNLRSQAVMERLGLRRDPMLDFDLLNDDVPWHGLVWVAEMRQGVTQV